jgi:hypothetical protein
MTAWHVDNALLRRWVDRTDALPHSASVEQHLLACQPCRDRVRVAAADDSAQQLPDLGVVWSQVRDAIELPQPSRFERLLKRVGLPAQDARLVAAAQAFRGPWLIGVLVVLGFVGLAAQFGHTRGEWFFLAVAPLVPCVAVAVSYDPDVDPALEQELATPYSSLRLVALRTVAVLASAVPVVVLVSLVLPVRAPYLWLMPAAGFVASVLALSTWINPLRGAVAISALWLAGVWLAAAEDGAAIAVLRTPFQIFYVCLIALSTGVLLTRGRHLREVRTRRGSS